MPSNKALNRTSPFEKATHQSIANGHQMAVSTHRMVAFGEYVDDGTASAMKARDYKDATDLIKSTTYIAGHSVRRLTPVECERLQGFPDNYTNVPDAKGKPAADGPRYKALGNSWAVPNVAWIFKRIDKVKALPNERHSDLI
jgi:DNA (cytosine-5)-methyltransferase 1